MSVGIIGGVSPYAFSIYYNQLCEKYRENTRGIYPQLLIYSIKVTEQQENKFLKNNVDKITEQEIEEELKKGCEIFKQNGIDTVVICCNTLSKMFCEVAELYKFKNIITPINCIHSYIKEKRTGKALLLATKYTNENLYKNISDIIKLDIFDQAELEKYIHDKINGKKDNNILENIIEKYKEKIDYIIFGCTDIEKKDIEELDNIEVLDSIDMMVNETLEKMR